MNVFGRLRISRQPSIVSWSVMVTFAHIYLEAASAPLLSDPVLVRRRCPAAVDITDKIDNLSPDGRMGKVWRMNTETHERFALESAAQRGVPSQTDRTSPTVASAVNDRSRRKCFTGAQIAQCSQSSRIFHFRIARCSFPFAAQQPRRRDKTAWF